MFKSWRADFERFWDLISSVKYPEALYTPLGPSETALSNRNVMWAIKAGLHKQI